MTDTQSTSPIQVRPRLQKISLLAAPFETARELPGEQGARPSEARILQRANPRSIWLEATADVTRELLAHRTHPTFDLVVRHAAACAEADVAALVLKADDGEWVMRARAGDFTGYPLGEAMDTGHTLAGRIIRSAQPELVDDFQREIADREIADENDFVAAIGAPILGLEGQVLGVVGVARRSGRPLFSEEDVEQLSDFTRQVGAALDLDRARTGREDARLGEERDRIAADLHDHVIQELFATAMGLQHVASSLATPGQQSQVLGYVGSLDETIRRIRQTIFTVQSHRWNLDSVQGRLLTVLDQQGDALGFSAEIAFAGPLRLGISDDLAEDIIAVVREGLSNVAKHARARHASVAVSLINEVVTVTVTDDGVGMNESARDSGLANLRYRAECRAGHFTATRPEGGGTRLEWTAVIPSEANSD